VICVETEDMLQKLMCDEEERKSEDVNVVCQEEMC